MNLIITLSGPSGVGKSTLERRLCERGLVRVISTTTRLPRPGERDGVDYHFVREAAFERMRQADELLEISETAGCLYGLSEVALTTALAQAEQAGGAVVAVLDPNGVRQIGAWARENGKRVLRVLMGNDPQLLVERMIAREMPVEPGREVMLAERINRLYQQELHWVHAPCWDLRLDGFGPNREEGVDLLMRLAQGRASLIRGEYLRSAGGRP